MSNLRIITPEELRKILELHVKWINSDPEGVRADLRSANLSSADLRSADLSSADLRSADLRFADLRSADLSSADLSSANLRSADLSFADLSSADLRFADLRSADLRSADLSSADLRSADLSSADLSSANLSFAEILTFKFNRHFSFCTFDGHLTIGCQKLELKEWAMRYKEIGTENDYLEHEIMAYGNFINLCIELQNNHDRLVK